MVGALFSNLWGSGGTSSNATGGATGGAGAVDATDVDPAGDSSPSLAGSGFNTADTFERSPSKAKLPPDGPKLAPTPANNTTPGIDRTALLNDMTGDIKDGRLKAKITSAAGSFSDSELKDMHDKGVKFAGPGGLPESRRMAGTNADNRISTPARYLPESRIIQVQDGRSTSTGQIRHEMAHAADDTRNDSHVFNDKAPTADREKLITTLNHEDAAGQAKNLRAEAAGAEPGRAAKLNAQAAKIEGQLTAGTPAAFDSDSPAMRAKFDAYRSRVGTDVAGKAFGTSTNGAHSLENPREFYAEGFNTFHASGSETGAAEAKRRLKENAPELYQQLKDEAKKNGTMPSDVAD